ncbi:MAG: hypothetical protein JWP03_3846, partial [Phycisphaerales bacterium]|nr:hypothetical protein [Phycisphaerales bacterium]
MRSAECGVVLYAGYELKARPRILRADCQSIRGL